MSNLIQNKEYDGFSKAIRTLKDQLSETKKQITEDKIKALKAKNAMLKKKRKHLRTITKQGNERELANTNELVILQQQIESEMWKQIGQKEMTIE